MDNPYQPPQSDIAMPNAQADSIRVFEKFSAWYVFGLSIVTLGLYNIYWLYTRTRILNKLKGVDAVSETFMQTVTALFVISVPLGYLKDIMPNASPGLIAITSLMSMAGSIMAIVWVFKFRNRLNAFLATTGKSTGELGPVMTFFFQIVYLSYKINENIELSETSVKV